PLPNDTPAYQVTGIHLTASLEEAWSHIRTVDLDESANCAHNGTVVITEGVGIYPQPCIVH
ncbi:hypothetical protein AHF37_12399, partial [Paragonimus kellicotti]